MNQTSDNLEKKTNTLFGNVKQNFKRGMLYFGIGAVIAVAASAATGFYVKSIYESHIAAQQQAHYETVQNLMYQSNTSLDGARIERGWNAGDLNKDGRYDIILRTENGQMYVLYGQEGLDLVKIENKSYFADSGKFQKQFDFYPIESAGPNDIPPLQIPIEGAGPSDVPPAIIPIEGAGPSDVPPARTP